MNRKGNGLVSKEVFASAPRAHQAAADATKSPQRKEAEQFSQEISKSVAWRIMILFPCVKVCAFLFHISFRRVKHYSFHILLNLKQSGKDTVLQPREATSLSSM